jgi:excisionase family DNA binding protein
MLYTDGHEVTIMTDRPLTISEAAELYKLDTSTLRHAIRRGVLAPAFKAGKTWFIERSEIEKWLENRNPDVGRPLYSKKEDPTSNNEG